MSRAARPLGLGRRGGLNAAPVVGVLVFKSDMLTHKT
jgi:hypothetical protein